MSFFDLNQFLKKHFTLIFSFLVLPTLLFGKPYSEKFLWDPNDLKSGDLTESIDAYQTVINWSTGKIITETSEKLTYSDPNIGRQLKNLNIDIRSELRQNMIKALAFVRISDMFLLRDYYSLKSGVRFEIIATVDNAFFYPPVNRSGSFLGVGELNLYGKQGLARIFYRDIKRVKVTKYIQNPPPKGLESFDTLVLDTLIFKEFNPSIQMRIYDQDGTLIYGPETMDPTALKKHGVCYYTTSLSRAFSSPRGGKKFFYVIPYDIRGKMKTDFVLHNGDAARLLAHPDTIKALRQGHVIVVRPKRERK